MPRFAQAVIESPARYELVAEATANSCGVYGSLREAVYWWRRYVRECSDLRVRLLCVPRTREEAA